MGIFDKLFRSTEPKSAELDTREAVLIHLDGTGLPDSVYDECDLMTLEDQLIAALGPKGEVDGNEIGEGVTTLFLYGLDSEAMYAAIEPVLISYPLCQNARVDIRKALPNNENAPQRTIQL
jgi:hypothetical protein